MWDILFAVGAVALVIGLIWGLPRLLKVSQEDRNFRSDDSNYLGPS